MEGITTAILLFLLLAAAVAISVLHGLWKFERREFERMWNKMAREREENLILHSRIKRAHKSVEPIIKQALQERYACELGVPYVEGEAEKDTITRILVHYGLGRE